MESLLAQTFGDFELIIVDDGSNDGSADIAQSYANQDARIKLIRQHRSNAGLARNRGLSEASGDYLMFLDADDYFEKTMLQLAYEKIKSADADICMFAANSYNNATGAVKRLPNSCKVHLFDDPQEVFSRETEQRYIFCCTSPAPWTKLYRARFVRDQGLLFQDLGSCNDLRFVLLAQACASRIVLVDAPLAYYRVSQTDSLQATQSKNPFDFYQALRGLQAGLIEKGLYSELESSFANTALDCCLYTLGKLVKSDSARKSVFEMLRNEGFDALGIDDECARANYVCFAGAEAQYFAIRSGSYQDYKEAYKNRLRKDGSMAGTKKAIRKILPLRSSVFEKYRNQDQKSQAAQQETLRALASGMEQQQVALMGIRRKLDALEADSAGLRKEIDDISQLQHSCNDQAEKQAKFLNECGQQSKRIGSAVSAIMEEQRAIERRLVHCQIEASRLGHCSDE